VGAVALFLFCTQVVESRLSSGVIKVDSDFVFLSRFCYDTRGLGTLHFRIWGENVQNMVFLIYNDVDPSDWKLAYSGKGMTCEERSNRARGHETITLGNRTIVSFDDQKRQHFWYFAVSNCGYDSININYELHMYNAGHSPWTKEFSFDEQGLEALYLFYFIVLFLGLAVHLYSVWVLIQSRSYHPIVRLLTISLVFEFSSVFFLFIHFVVYSGDGIGVPGLYGFGTFLDIVAQVVFILMLILISKGWAITKTQLEDRKANLVMTIILFLSYLALFIWQMLGMDHASDIYVYESPPGIVVIVVRALAMMWFIYCLRGTFSEENHPTKRKFYLTFGVCYIVWFLILPLITAISAGVDPWVRMKTVFILYITSNAVALAGMGYLLWPTRANEYFQISSHLDIAGTIPYDTI